MYSILNALVSSVPNLGPLLPNLGPVLKFGPIGDKVSE